MANHLSNEKKSAVVSMLAEGNSIRGIERMTGIHQDTICRLGVRMGQGCAKIMDERFRGLDCRTIQLDETWGFVGMKQKTANRLGRGDEVGDVWTWVAVDAESKLVPCFHVGGRGQADANVFLENLASRLAHRVHISTDGLHAYRTAIENAFGAEEVDYGILIKTYSNNQPEDSRRYSPPEVVSVDRNPVLGEPDMSLVSTSYVEKQNHTLRMHCRRMSRLTNAFSKKLENFKAAIALHYGYYNLVKFNKAVRCTPAMAAGVVDSQWTVNELVEMIEG